MATLIVVSLLVLATAFYLLWLQSSMLYMPKAYGAEHPLKADGSIVELEYASNQGQQIAYYLPPKAKPDALPNHVYMLFNGNASLALNWYELASRHPDGEIGFLLYDYPGYGACAGKPSPTAIAETSDKALAALSQHLNIETHELEKRLSVMGHSLGAATALQFAAHHPVATVVLIAPFTTLQEMACRVVGKPICYFLTHHLNNGQRLAELAKREPPPNVTIFHGDEDETIPVEMGRQLAQEFPHLVTYKEIKGCNHSDILTVAEADIHAAINYQKCADTST
ncbi:MAG: alpha/beta hydrolase [Gammaproteobacteria bacterium]|nr:alpha/beta hydrolase [Gammaproteobacteria bacterium]